MQEKTKQNFLKDIEFKQAHMFNKKDMYRLLRQISQFSQQNQEVKIFWNFGVKWTGQKELQLQQYFDLFEQMTKCKNLFKIQFKLLLDNNKPILKTQLLKSISHIQFMKLDYIFISTKQLVNIEPLSWINAPNLTHFRINIVNVKSLKPLLKTNFKQLRTMVLYPQCSIRFKYQNFNRCKFRSIYSQQSQQLRANSNGKQNFLCNLTNIKDLIKSEHPLLSRVSIIRWRIKELFWKHDPMNQSRYKQVINRLDEILRKKMPKVIINYSS